MPENVYSDSRKVLIRSKEARGLRLVALVAVAILILYCVWSCFYAWRYGEWFDLIVYVGIAVVLSLFVLQLVNKMHQKVVLLENHFSVTGLWGVPKIYSYDQITNLETVVDNWDKWALDFEPFVRVTFADGGTVRLHEGLMRSLEFRKFLRKKTGKIFRKPKSKKHG